MSNVDHIADGAYGVPKPELDRRFTVFDIEELYQGPLSPGREVPNPRDLVIDYVGNRMLRTVSTDYSNYTYEFEDFNPLEIKNGDADIGGCSPEHTDTYRVYVNTSKHPASLRFDTRVTVPGSDLQYCRLFRGINTRSDGTVLSGRLTAGRLSDNTLELELVQTVGNVTVKSVKPGVCIADVEDGELVTAIFYAADNEPALAMRLYVVLTNMVMALDAPAKQILDIKLISPFISPSDDTQLVLPINIPIADIPMQAEIRYTDGVRRVNVDGTKVQLHGLLNSGSHDTFYVSSNVGQTLPLNLFYRLSANETYVGSNIVDGVINKQLSATTLEVDGAYSVKLFVVPRWLDVERGYRLSYFLCSLERGNVFDATAFVEVAINSAAFDPTLYGVKQRLVVKVDLSRVNPMFVPHIHPQSFHITLVSPGNDERDDFIIEYVPNQAGFGATTRALFYYDNVTFWMLNLASGAASKEEWLQLMYYATHPLFDSRTEDTALVPTHFRVVTRTNSYVRTVDSWMNAFNVDTGINEGDTIRIEWIRRTPNDDLMLGVSSLLAHQRP